MERASASCTDSKRLPSEGFIRLMRNPSLPPPPRKFEPTEKAPGSFILTRDGLVEVGR